MSNTTQTKRPNLRLYADRILVKVITPEEVTTKSGLIIPELAKDGVSKTEHGLVVRVSSQVAGATSEWEQISEGEVVMYSSFAGSEVFYEGVSYKILRFTDIFCGIEDKEDVEDSTK